MAKIAKGARRETILRVLVNDDEDRIIRAAALRAGCSVSAWLRQLGLAGARANRF